MRPQRGYRLDNPLIRARTGSGGAKLTPPTSCLHKLGDKSPPAHGDQLWSVSLAPLCLPGPEWIGCGRSTHTLGEVGGVQVRPYLPPGVSVEMTPLSERAWCVRILDVPHLPRFITVSVLWTAFHGHFDRPTGGRPFFGRAVVIFYWDKMSQ